MLLVCIIVWCGTFVFPTFTLNDLPLIGLLLIAMSAFFISQAVSRPAVDAIILLAGVTFGKGAGFFLKAEDRGQKTEQSTGIRPPASVLYFLVGLVLLLAFGSLRHFDVAHNFYPGTRWTGLWENPNTYGMLMAAGVVLATGLLAASLKSTVHSPQPVDSASEQREAGGGKRNFLRSLRSFATRWIGEHSRPGCHSTRLASNTGNANDEASLATRGSRVLPIILFIAAGMMGVGLMMSYSRGAWVGAAVGLLYLAKAYGKFKWRSLKLFLFSVFCFLFLIFGVCFFWNTPRTAPWYFQRLDLSRGSAQHRVVAWKAGLEIMRDHPFGVGWNKTVETYEKSYSPPEDGADAITTNDYLMLGTQLGWPGLICFVAYVGLCLRGRAANPLPAAASPNQSRRARSDAPYQTACRAGALAMLVAFWFDGGLFKLATASVFWILLELGTEAGTSCCGVRAVRGDGGNCAVSEQGADCKIQHKAIIDSGMNQVDAMEATPHGY